MKEKTLQEKLRIKSGMIFMGEKIEFGSECALMDCAADYIDALLQNINDLQKQLKDLEKDNVQLKNTSLISSVISSKNEKEYVLLTANGGMFITTNPLDIIKILNV
jgi:hypothetical protein